jgi:hypothetical protein
MAASFLCLRPAPMTTTRRRASCKGSRANSEQRGQSGDRLKRREKDSDPTTLSTMRLPRPRTPRAWRRARRTVVAAGVAALALALLVNGPVGAALFGAVLLSLIVLEAIRLQDAILEAQRQQYALTQIRPLFGDLPLDLSGWAADPILIHNAVRLIVEARPRLVLECGSGSSTIAIARCLKALGSGRIISLDHDSVYARRTHDLVRLCSLDDQATVVTAPLVPRSIGSVSHLWYGPGYETLLGQKIDLLLVDGPPGATGPQARYPAVPLLKSHLADECWILMDDGNRSDERDIARAWSEELGADLRYLEGGRGGWLLHRGSTATEPVKA